MNPVSATADESAPPVPPDVQQQQDGNPLQQYGRGAAQQNFQQGSSLDFVGKLMKEVAERLQKAAQVLSVDAPEVMPIWKTMVGAGAQLEKALQQKKQSEAQASSPGLAPAQAAMQPAEGPPAMSY